MSPVAVTSNVPVTADAPSTKVPVSLMSTSPPAPTLTVEKLFAFVSVMALLVAVRNVAALLSVKAASCVIAAPALELGGEKAPTEEISLPETARSAANVTR